MSERSNWMIAGLDSGRVALEIAPLDKPVLPRDEWNVRYADHLNTSGLLRKYQGHAMVNPGAIEQVDYVVGREGLLDAVGNARFNAVVASHVIEHVPNPVRWLQEIHAISADGGLAVFAIPDRLRCFDGLRRPTVVSEWLGAWLDDAWRPAARNVIDALLDECSWRGKLTWAGEPVEKEFIHNRQPSLALSMAQRAVMAADYYDVHCWAFQTAEFFAILHTLAVLDLFPFEFHDYRATEGNEFLVKLRRNDASTWASRVASIPLGTLGRAKDLPADFSVRAYLEYNKDLVEAQVDPIQHWLEYGRNENRKYA